LLAKIIHEAGGGKPPGEGISKNER